MFIIAMVYVLGKLIIWGLKATWSIMKFVCAIILLPMLLVGLVLTGCIYLAMLILIVAGIIAIVGGLVNGR
jgi:hypothetical protein